MATGQLTESARGRLRLSGTPVFLYHGLTSSSAPKCPRRQRKYWVAAVHFREHLASIGTDGRRVALLPELWSSSGPSERENLPIALTFDDGRCSDYEIAFPHLLEAGIRAEFFVNTATIGTKGFLSWQQVSEMQRRGMSFQSHSHDHVDLSRLPLREKEQQLKRSKQVLEDRLGCEVKFLAVPFGRLSAEVVRVAVTTGYRAVCTSRSWPAQPGARLVNRVVVYAHTDQLAFRGLLTGRPASYFARFARAVTLFLPKQLLAHFFQPRNSATTLESLT